MENVVVKTCYDINMILGDYFHWHYTVAPAVILGLLKNYLVGTWHRFLITTHFKTLFSPWHRVKTSDFGETKNFGDKIVNGIIEFYIRILAAAIRLTIILVGLVIEAMVVFVFIALLIAWLLWPAIFIWSVGNGLSFLLA